MLGDNPLAEFAEGSPGIDGKRGIGEDSCGLECDLGEMNAKFAETAHFFAIKDSDGFFDFEGISGRPTKGLIHVGDDGFDFEAGGGAD